MDDIQLTETGFTIHGDRALLFKALAAAQGQFKEVLKTRENPFFKSQYADLADVLNACVPALNANGLGLFQPPCRASATTDWTVRTLLTHESGAYIEVLSSIPPVADWQKFGSAVTYCRRYVAGALLGVAPEPDDDGNAATHDKAPQARQESPRRGPPPLPAQAAVAPTAKAEPAKAAAPKEPVEMLPKGSPLRDETKQVIDMVPEPDFHVEDGPRTLVDEPAEQDGPASKDLKLSIRVAMMALHLSPPEVVRKLAQWFPGVPMPKIAESKVKSQQLLDMLMADVELVPGLVQRLPEIRSEQLKLASAQ